MESLWSQVDDYLAAHLVPGDEALDNALATSAAAGLPAINVTATQGKLLQLLARACRARRILELGTLGAYSTIWLGRGLPADGELFTLEIDPAHAAVARHNIERAGLADRVSVVLGAASDTLAKLVSDGVEPFDFVFIDADKANIDTYFTASLQLSRVGTVIVVDNVVRKGDVIDAASEDVNVRGVRRLFDLLANEPRVSCTALQTVGGKGYDGLILALVASL
ncbi:MAG: O-methyltransferase [Gemmatimonadaceae bacterium]